MGSTWQRALLPVVVVSGMWIAGTLATSIHVRWLDREMHRVLAENVASIRASTEMEAIVWRMHAMAVSASKGDRSVTIEEQDLVDAQFEAALRQASGAVRDPLEEPLVKAIEAAFTNYEQNWRRLCSHPATLDDELPKLVTHLEQITKPSQDLRALNERLMEDAERRREELGTWYDIARTLMLLVGPTIGIVLGVRLSKDWRRSISQLSVKLHDVAGELWEEVGVFELKSELDMPQLQKQLDVVADRIHGIVDELRETRREAVHSERLAAVGELSAGIAHELRNPLTSLKLLLQTAEHRPDKTLPPRSMQVMLEEIARMESTIQGLLDFARPRELRRQMHDVRQTVQRALNLIESRAKQQRVSVVPRFAAEPVEVDADPELLHQVCVNLLLNGIESMHEGGEFVVEVRSSKGDHAARIEFVDSGAGIPKEMLPRLFEPFATSKDHGTGLGLAVSRRIIAEHSGKLLARNRQEGGAAFTIELPLAS